MLKNVNVILRNNIQYFATIISHSDSNKLMFHSNKLLFHSNAVLFHSNKLMFHSNAVLFHSNILVYCTFYFSEKEILQLE